MKSQRAGRKFLLWCLLSVIVALLLLIYALYVIRPFRAQGARELLVALAVLRYRTLGLALCLLSVAAATAWYWGRETRRARRWISTMGVVAVAAAALLSRVNVYELMFHPAERPTFSPANEAKLDGGEMVIAVKVGSSARAYAIRGMSYHHIVNDSLDGVPIVATY